jgi:hypothetical protein
MGTQQVGWSNAFLNTALVVLGLVVLVLLVALIRSNWVSSTDATRDANPTGLVGDIIQVEVRNGCGVSGLAEKMTHFLRGEGFDVVEVGNYASFDQAQTIVIDRVGNLEAAQKVALALGLAEDRVKQEIRQDYFLDASVIIGKDYASLPALADE